VTMKTNRRSSILDRRPAALIALMIVVLISPAQTQRPSEELSIQGYSAQAAIVRLQGRALVDVQDLARMTNGSLSFQGNRVILTLPDGYPHPTSHADDDIAGFSPAFMKAAIEAMAATREWGGTLLVVIQNGYPVGNTMGGNAIAELQSHAADSVAFASAAASNRSDYQGLEFLKNEFNRAQAWSDDYIKARNSLSAAAYTSGTALEDDDQAQKILQCGQFLGQMFASGRFQDDPVCR
jgi:hypothetical protein